MTIRLVIANPYAYDRAMEKAISQAQELQESLQVVFFISSESLGKTIHEMAETGWLGAATLHDLQASMLAGYRALADDVLKRVERKVTVADNLELIIGGVMEGQSLWEYIESILSQGATKVIIAASNVLTPKLDNIPDRVEYIIEE